MTEIEKTIEPVSFHEMVSKIRGDFDALICDRKLFPSRRGKPGLIDGNPADIYSLFEKGIKSGLKDHIGIQKVRINPVDIPDEYKVEGYIDGRAYEITAEVHPKYETTGGKPREVTIFYVFTLNRQSRTEVYATDSLKRITPVDAVKNRREVAAARAESSERYHEVLANGLQKPLRGGLPSLGKKRP